MKYHLDTIPIWDIYREQPGECPLCLLQRRTEQRLIESFLGGSVMESDTRIEVNAKGFCSRHFGQLEQIQNRLGLALLLQSHLKEVIDKQKKIMASPGAKGLFANKKESPAQQSAEAAQGLAKRCIACDRLDFAMGRYAYTLAHMVMNEAGFAPAFEKAHGVCMPHYALLLGGAKELGGKDGREFADLLMKQQLQQMEQMQAHIDAFTVTFDYRNRGQATTAPPDTVKRAVRLLKGPGMG